MTAPAEPEGKACGSISAVRSDATPAQPLPTCANCGSNLIAPAPPAARDEVREALAAFGAVCLREWWGDGNPGDIDGGAAQEAAEEAGLWHQVERHADGVECEWCGNEGPCGEMTAVGLAALSRHAPAPAVPPAVREAAERLWHRLTPPVSTTANGCLYVPAEDLEKVLRALAAKPTTQPAGDEVREAAEIIRAILAAHDARLSDGGCLTYGHPRSGTGFPAAIEWLRRYDAAKGGA